MDKTNGQSEIPARYCSRVGQLQTRGGITFPDDNDPKLDPWNRKILPWRKFGDPGPRAWKWNDESNGTIQWRYTSVEGKLVDIYIVYR